MSKKLEATYILVIKISEDFKTIVGKLGEISFREGYYIYVGSARGCLETRLRRHLRKDKKIYWHIDYLLQNGKVQILQIWVIQNSIECWTADVFNKNSLSEVVKKGFGSSDCNCLTHLFYIKNKEKAESILKEIGFSKIIDLDFKILINR